MSAHYLGTFNASTTLALSRPNETASDAISPPPRIANDAV
jgi:hypothetical protein